MEILLEIIKQEFLILWSKPSRVLSNFLFFIIFMVIFFLIAQESINQNSIGFLTTIALMSLLTSTISFYSQFLQKDFEDGTLEQLSIICLNFELVILGKIFANWTSSCFTTIVSLGILSLFYKPELAFVIKFISIIFFASLALNFVCGFCGSLSTLCNSTSFLALIAIPLIIPILLISSMAIRDDFNFNFQLLVAMTIFLSAISSIATTKIIKIANE